MERIRRRGEEESAKAKSSGGTHPFDDLRPWNWVWNEAVNNSEKFWKRELENPGLRVLSRTDTLSNTIDGDVQIELTDTTVDHGQSNKRRDGIPTPTTPAITKKHPRDSDHTSPPAKSHRVKDGQYTHNRSNTPLCADFQTGACTEVAYGVRCRRDGSLAHNCSKCLSANHGAHKCDTTKAPTPPMPPKGKGGKGKKGKGKGKGWSSHH